jgi:hypothetical protein
MSAARVLVVVALAAVHAPTVAAQAAHDHAAGPVANEALVASFVEAARDATRRYHDRAAAIADGFRLLGPDFPAMGEHWVQPGRMVEGRLDVTRPQALSYAIIDGRAVLTGVIYAKPLMPGEALPAFPGPAFPWHDHAGAIDEESVLLHHVPTSGDEAGGVRLTMLHAWVWVANPDGVFAADNWALPFIRLGLDVPEHIPADAARMLSLLAGGDRYYRMLLRSLARPTPEEEAAAAARIAAARARLEARFPGAARGQALDDAALEGLATGWRELWAGIAGELRPAAASRLHPLLLPADR